MSLPTIITAEWLRAQGAWCDVETFEREWPDGTPVTVESLRRLMALGLHVEWLSVRLPAPALTAYREAEATAWAAYDEATAPARAAYDEARATALVKAWAQATGGEG